MDFSLVDAQFSKWANEHSLCIKTEYKGENVRSVVIQDDLGNKWQLWLEPLAVSNECVIKYWDYKDKREQIKISANVLKDELDKIIVKLHHNTE